MPCFETSAVQSMILFSFNEAENALHPHIVVQDVLASCTTCLQPLWRKLWHCYCTRDPWTTRREFWLLRIDNRIDNVWIISCPTSTISLSVRCEQFRLHRQTVFIQIRCSISLYPHPKDSRSQRIDPNTTKTCHDRQSGTYIVRRLDDHCAGDNS